MNKDAKLNPDIFSQDMVYESNRLGFGEGLLEAGKIDDSIVAMTADLTESTQVELFKKAFPDRFIEVGVAEQNMVTIASGLAAVGKKPFTTSYASFSPGRNWEQIRTTICLNDRNVKIVGCHAGVSVGPDGATHQMLEDIALMRALPNMTVIVPCDSIEARKATMALAKTASPGYLRLAKEKTAVVTTDSTPFVIGKALVLRDGKDLTLVACGTLVYEALKAAEELAKQGVDVEVINCPTIKPLDNELILKSANKTKKVITVEEAQASGGLGGAVAELISEQSAATLWRIGFKDRYGQSGDLKQLWAEYQLDSASIMSLASKLLKAPKR
jgi:transketolase